MTIATVRRLAADILNVGRNKVRIDPDNLKEAEGALTRADVRSLIDKGIVRKAKRAGRASTRRTGRRGRGRRRGTPVDSKTAWMDKIRSQRAFLNTLLDSGALKKESKRSLYGKIKSGIFRNKRAMLLYLKDNSLVPADFEPAKRKREEPPKRSIPKPKAQKSQKKEEKPAPREQPHARHAAKEKGEQK
jgi:large subunit ribosomal protein L19e